MKRSIDVGEGKKLTVEVTPAMVKAARDLCKRLVEFGAKYDIKCAMCTRRRTLEELATLHGPGVFRAIEKAMKQSILTDAAVNGCRKAYAILARSKDGRWAIEQLKIRKPK